TPSASPTPIPTPTIPPTSILAISVFASPRYISEGGTAIFTVTTSSPASTARTVNYTMIGRAIYGAQYTLSGTPGRAVIPAGATSATVTLTSVPDSLRRGSRAATIVLEPGNGYQIAFPNQAS